MLTFIFLSILSFHTAMAIPIQKDSQKAALQEEVNVLVYGVLQFSTALHSLYESTAEKLARIKDSTDLYDQGLRLLHHLTQRAKQDQKEIQRALVGLKAENMRLQQQADCNKKRLQEVFGEHQNLKQQVKALEEMLLSMEKQSFQNKGQGVAALKAHMQQQNLTIWSLQGATQQQQQQMAQQTRQMLQMQEEMRNHRGAKWNVEELDKDTIVKFVPSR